MHFSSPMRTAFPVNLNWIILIILGEEYAYGVPNYAFPPTCCMLSFRSKCSQDLVHIYAQTYSYNMRDRVSHLNKPTSKITVWYILIFTFIGGKPRRLVSDGLPNFVVILHSINNILTKITYLMISNCFINLRIL